MVKPPLLKFECPNCKYTKLVKPTSDVLNILDFSNSCPKCNSAMIKVELNFFDKMKEKIFN